VFHTSRSADAAVEEVTRRRGTWFDPKLVDAFVSVARAPGFWENLRAADLQQRLFDLEPAREVQHVDDDYLDEIAAAFAQVVDSKSAYTAGHSERVALYVDRVSEQLGIAPERRRRLRRGALLHDIGKLGVSNTILDKPGKPTAADWDAIRQHPVHGERILSRIAAFADLAAMAGGHHERLDGKGYPRGIASNDISLDVRILTVADIFDALTADRPYRKASSPALALAIMAGDVGTAIDPDCFAALRCVVENGTLALVA
jgi:HD-GYP domain-containing protein (c-di-GMP phosphodiesterase class II)